MFMRKLALSAAWLALSIPAVGARAQDINLRVADSFPIGHYAVEEGLKPFMEMVSERTGGQVEFTHFPASQLGKAQDLMQLLQSGVADMAYIQPSYLSDKLPLSSLVGLPGLVKDSCSSSKAYLAIGGEGGPLAAQEFVPNGMKLVLAFVTRPYQLQSKKQLESMDDFKGLKVRSGGGTQEIAVNSLGAVPIRVAGPEMYEALSRGTADGVILPLASVLSYDLQSLVKHSTKTASFGSTAILYMVSDAVWDRFTPEQQMIVLEAGREASIRACEFIDAQFDEVVGKLTDAGVQVADLPEAENAKLSEALDMVTNEWVEQMEADGRPAKSLLETFRAEAAKE